jgi:hypothetical protein
MGMLRRSRRLSPASSGKRIVTVPPTFGDQITVREETDLGHGVKRTIIEVPLRYPGLNENELALLRRGMTMMRTAFLDAKTRLSED